VKPQNEILWPLIEEGQIWQMNETTCRIGQLGKKLVHYILFKGQPTHNAPIVTNKEVLTKQLQEMKAVLVRVSRRFPAAAVSAGEALSCTRR
jgi:hypothetical protein